MRVVLDTNVLVSGLLKPYGTPGEIVRMTSAGTMALCHDARIMTEYRDVLLRPRFGFRPADVNALLDQIQACGYPVAASPLPRPLKDRDDEIFLEAALAGGAAYLITGNLSDYAGHGQPMKIVSPAQFLERYRDSMRLRLNMGAH